MHRKRSYLAVGLAAALLAVSASSADARWYHGGHYGHGGYYGHGPGLVGGVVVGALTLATLPFAIIGSVVAPSHGSPGYGDGYGPPPPPPGYGRDYYGPPAPPPGYYRNYGPPQRYYGGY